MKFNVEQAAYHRNGVTGEGFYVGIAMYNFERGEGSHRILVTFFPEHDDEGEPCPAGKDRRGEFANGRVAVVRLDDLVNGNLESKWRGDHFSDVADAIVAKVHRQYDDERLKSVALARRKRRRIIK